MQNSGKANYPRVDQIANRTFVSLDENVLVADAAKTLYERKECTIIVTRNRLQSRIPVGIITERDIIYRIVAQNRGPFKVTLKDIMSTPLITANSKSSIDEALNLMKENDITRLPVVNDKGIIIGLLTMKILVGKLPVKKAALSE